MGLCLETCWGCRGFVQCLNLKLSKELRPNLWLLSWRVLSVILYMNNNSVLLHVPISLGFFLMVRGSFFCPVILLTILEGFAALYKLVFPLLSAYFCVFICDSKPCWNGSLRHLFLRHCQSRHLSCFSLTIICICAVRFMKLILCFEEKQKHGACLLCRLLEIFFPVILTVLVVDQILHMAGSSRTHDMHFAGEGRLFLWEYFVTGM